MRKPLIRARRPGLSLVQLIVLGLAAAPWPGLARAQPAQGSQPTPQAVPVQAAPPRRQDVPVWLSSLGTVQALNVVNITAQVSGILQSIPVKEGQMVAANAVVAIIDPRPYQATLDAAVAQKAEDQTQLSDAQLDLTRYTELAKRSYAPQQQVDTQKALVDKLAATVAADQAHIESAQLNLNDCTIQSPISGRVGLVQINPGNLIQAGGQTPIITITQTMPIGLLFTLPQNELDEVRKAMAAGQVSVQVMPSATDTAQTDKPLASGRLLTINNTVDATSGTFQLKAEFANPGEALWPGQFVNVRLLANTLHNVLTVPHLAVQNGPQGRFVWMVGADNTVHRTNVTISYDDGSTAVIGKGLDDTSAAQARVVTAGQSRLAEGAHVSVGAQAAG